MKEHNLIHLGQNLLLHPFKAIFWREKGVLLVSDIHFGKATHFRKYGIAVPDNVHSHDLERLGILIAHYQPAKLIILGDLFHSDYNQSWELFRQFVMNHPKTKMGLIPGNHDVMPNSNYDFLQVYIDGLIAPPYIFTHEPLSAGQPGNLYNIHGHLHPCFTIRGIAKQSLSLPCFYFSNKFAVMPAFGSFTGNCRIRKSSRADHVFIITESSVVPLFSNSVWS